MGVRNALTNDSFNALTNDSLTPLEAAEDTTSMICNPEVNGCRTQTNWSILLQCQHTLNILLTLFDDTGTISTCVCERERMNNVAHTIYIITLLSLLSLVS